MSAQVFPAPTHAILEPVFRSGNVVVTPTLVQIAGASYPVNGIGSVMVFKPRRVGLYVVAAIAVLIGLASIRSGGLVALLIGAVLVAVALLLPHRLMIRTASSNQQALASRNRAFLFSVKQAIETAVAMRG